MSVRVAILKMAGWKAAADFARRRSCGGRRSPTEIVVGKDEADLAAPDFVDQCLAVPNGTELEIDKGGVLEEAEEEHAPRAGCQRSQAAFQRMPGGENERRAQPRDGALHFA